MRIGEGAGEAVLVIGTVRLMHVRDDLLNERNHTDIAALSPAGRLAGSGYAYIRQFFSMPRPGYDHEKAQ